MTEVASPRHEFVSFLSDYGRSDEFVGVCRSVMLSLAPHLRIIDVTHDVPPHDVRSGALTLVRAAQYLPVGIILVVNHYGANEPLVCRDTDINGW